MSRSRRSRSQRQRRGPQWGFPLPKDLRETLGGEGELEGLLSKIENPALLTQRYVPYPRGGLPQTKWEWEIDGINYKNNAWQGIEEMIGSLHLNLISEWLNKIRSRKCQMEGALCQNGYKIRKTSVKVAWRLVIGMGLPSPMEVGLTLHHIYGFPYLPGSSVKGVTRNWRIQQMADELKIPRLSPQEMEGRGKPTPWQLLERLLMFPKREDWDKLKEALKEIAQLPDFNEIKGELEEFSRIFGSTDAKGEVLFFDAYPDSLSIEGKPILELDVMTPHYGEYYTGESPPADYLSPKPVLFLVVREGASFTIRLASRCSTLLNKAEGWVKEALQEFGLGAKTGAGYGELI